MGKTHCIWACYKSPCGTIGFWTPLKQLMGIMIILCCFYKMDIIDIIKEAFGNCVLAQLGFVDYFTSEDIRKSPIVLCMHCE